MKVLDIYIHICRWTITKPFKHFQHSCGLSSHGRNEDLRYSFLIEKAAGFTILDEEGILIIGCQSAGSLRYIYPLICSSLIIELLTFYTLHLFRYVRFCTYSLMNTTTAFKGPPNNLTHIEIKWESVVAMFHSSFRDTFARSKKVILFIDWFLIHIVADNKLLLPRLILIFSLQNYASLMEQEIVGILYFC